ncbi:PREDICTED: uncharacterized protein LOC104587275 [Nelumbo nucifera]|uniref:Sulfite exporter TauE/SafE family protein 4 n=2 Tax=Nelumbo nucifera TaxID=4432 RepID=A0A823A426_NELNU|nr:PREDICTED: uncharacterized protein LOC104587275 [Nelumbo nucifera]DAD48708.1 TPA_asm: hypothetical protein HUJ06_018645 [Nelumbo nucifera]
MTTRRFLLYLLCGFSMAILSTFFLADSHDYNYPRRLYSLHSTSVQYPAEALNNRLKVWPKLKFSWRIVLATVIGFLGSAFGMVGGVGGGGIFVPMLNLIVGFDTKSAAALSKCMIMGASTSSVWYNLRVPHPTKDVPIIDYDLALLFQPMLMLGITIGVALSVAFPNWLITVLVIVLFLGTSSRSFFKGIEMWNQETIILKKEQDKQQEAPANYHGEQYEPQVLRTEKSQLEILRFNLRWQRILVLLLVWFSFLFLQVLKNGTAVCGAWYWVLNVLQFPVALLVHGYEARKLYKESRNRRVVGNSEAVCEATIDWTALHLAFCAFCGIIGGIVGGLLGSGGGFILGPLLLELGVIPQVASATATFVMMFSSSLSVVEFYLLKRFPIPYALYLIAVSMMAGLWGQFLIRKVIEFLKRTSIVVFILSSVIFASAVTMGVAGIKNSILMIHNHEYMGFLCFCES